MFNAENEKEKIAEIELTDGVITLKPFRPEDAEAHLAGDDEEQQKWLSGGKSTLETVQNWIARNQGHWEAGGPIYNFAIWAEDTLVGMIEANTDVEKIEGLSEGDANLSYGTYPDARGKGYVSRAVKLIVTFLKEKGIRRAVIRVLPENESSVRVPIACGFTEAGTVETKEGTMTVYIQQLNP